MRMIPNRYQQPKPARIKQRASAIKHLSAPLKGMSLNSKLVPGDPLTASVLTNFVVDDDRITCRAGVEKRMQTAAKLPIWHLIPYYGTPSRLAAATDNTLIDAITGAMLKAGFSSNDWHWTSFSNLSENDYTVMVNGKDGVWSWNGGGVIDPGPLPIVVLDNTNPARVTVSSENIGNFANGQTVVIAGATGDMVAANGSHVIGNVGASPFPNSFVLIGVDLSAGAGPQVGGLTADPPGSIAKELVTAPTNDPWVVPDEFAIVLSHMNRLWFADSANLAVYYLPIEQKSGQLEGVLPLNAIFRKGGSIRALATWTLDGGRGMEDQLAIFTTNGEVAIWQGIDPADQINFRLTGVFRFDAPMSKHSVINYGGDLYVLIGTGLTPMTTMLRAETEQLGQLDKSVISLFLAGSTKYRDRPGWQVFQNPSTSRVYCNIPLGSANRYTQMVRHMPRPVWSQFMDIPARCWGWIEPNVYFGDDSGAVYEMHPRFLSDDGKPIYVDMQSAWSAFNTPAAKQFKMVLPYIITDGVPKPYVDIRVDYDMSPAANQPDVTTASLGATWNLATWNEDFWAETYRSKNNWSGVGAIGRVGAVRVSAAVLNCEFSIAGFDVIYESGSLFG